MTFTPNPDGIERLFAEIAAKLERVDAQIRAEHTGKPAAEVAQHAKQAFSSVGVNLTDGDIASYAESVEADKPFQIHLQ